MVCAGAWDQCDGLPLLQRSGRYRQVREDHRPESHLIPIVLQVAQGKRPHLDLYGTDYATRDGTASRDYVHVRDLARAHLRAIEEVTPVCGVPRRVLPVKGI